MTWPDRRPGEGKVWDAQTGQVLFGLKGHTRGGVHAVAFSPDGKRLASVGSGEVKLWEAQTGQELLSLPFKGLVNTITFGSVAFSPDGRRVATSGGENGENGTGPRQRPGVVKVWDASTGQELLTVKHPSRLYGVAFSPDGKRLASASGAGWTVKVWDAQTGQEILSFQGGSIRVAFSPDGKRLATGSSDTTVRVWDAETGRELLSLKGHADWVRDVAFSPDGKRLASTDNKTVKVWDAETGSELLTVPGSGGVAFSPDGNRLASGTEGGTVTIYDATPLPEESPAKEKAR